MASLHTIDRMNEQTDDTKICRYFVSCAKDLLSWKGRKGACQLDFRAGVRSRV